MNIRRLIFLLSTLFYASSALSFEVKDKTKEHCEQLNKVMNKGPYIVDENLNILDEIKDLGVLSYDENPRYEGEERPFIYSKKKFYLVDSGSVGDFSEMDESLDFKIKTIDARKICGDLRLSEIIIGAYPLERGPGRFLLKDIIAFHDSQNPGVIIAPSNAEFSGIFDIGWLAFDGVGKNDTPRGKIEIPKKVPLSLVIGLVNSGTRSLEIGKWDKSSIDSSGDIIKIEKNNCENVKLDPKKSCTFTIYIKEFNNVALTTSWTAEIKNGGYSISMYMSNSSGIYMAISNAGMSP
jgi:hypothetical protein